VVEIVHAVQFLCIFTFYYFSCFFFFSSRRRHTRCLSDWSSDVCSSDLSNTERKTDWEDAFLSLGVRVPPSLLRESGLIDWRAVRSEERRVGKECRCGWVEETCIKNRVTVGREGANIQYEAGLMCDQLSR